MAVKKWVREFSHMAPGLVLPEKSIKDFYLMIMFEVFSVFYMRNSVERSNIKAMMSP